MSITTLAGVLSLLVTAGSATGPARQRFAVVVGANEGVGQRTLVHALSDARAFREVIRQLGGVREQDDVLLDNPESSELLEAIGRVGEAMERARAKGGQPELIFYYSGHSDETGLLLKDGVLPYRALRRKLESAPADFRISILDSCSSGTFTRAKGGTRVAPFLLDTSATVKGAAVLTSSSPAELSQESDALGGSYFTRNLLAGLRGGADVSGDGTVTLNEAYRYAFDATLAQTQDTALGPQHPSYEMAVSGRGEVVMTDLRATGTVLSLARELEGKFFVRDARGQLVLELEKRAGYPLELALDPGQYRLALVHGESLREGDLVLPREGRAELTPQMLAERPREVNRARGSEVSETEPSELQVPAPKAWVVRVGVGTSAIGTWGNSCSPYVPADLPECANKTGSPNLLVGAELEVPLLSWLALNASARFINQPYRGQTGTFWMEPNLGVVFRPFPASSMFQPRISTGASLIVSSRGNVGAAVAVGIGFSARASKRFGLAVDFRAAYGSIQFPIVHLEALVGPELYF